MNRIHCIGGVMVSVLFSSAVDCGFEPKTYKIGIAAPPLFKQQ